MMKHEIRNRARDIIRLSVPSDVEAARLSSLYVERIYSELRRFHNEILDEAIRATTPPGPGGGVSPIEKLKVEEL